jgi:hypothetical protein
METAMMAATTKTAVSRRENQRYSIGYSCIFEIQ